MRVLQTIMLAGCLAVTTACSGEFSVGDTGEDGEFAFEDALEEAEAGDATQQYNVAQAYAEGLDGVTPDRAEAIRWYRLSADQGFAPAQYNLARAYATGNGVGQDFGEARKLYMLAAEQGDASATHNIGVLYTEGKGVEVDMAIARDWFEKGAALDHPKSQFNLAMMNARGIGGEANFVSAHLWFKVLMDNPEGAEFHGNVSRLLTELEAEMSGEQLEQARELFEGRQTPGQLGTAS